MTLLCIFRNTTYILLKFNANFTLMRNYSSPSVKQKSMIRNILMNQLNIKRRVLNSLIKNDVTINNLSESHLLKIASILKTNNIDLTNIDKYTNILFSKPALLKHRIYLLQELGIKDVNVSLISNYQQIMNLSTKLFKAHLQIPQNTNLMENIYSHLKNAPSIPVIENEDDMLISEYYQISLKHYLIWKLNLTEEEKEDVFNKISTLYRSIRIYESTITVLQNECKLSNKAIKKYIRLVTASSEIIPIYEKLLEISPEASSMITRCPLLLNKNVENISKIMEITSNYGIPMEHLRKWPEVLLINPDIFENRLQTLLTYSEVRIFLNHPRFLKLVLYFQMVQIRLKYMREFSYHRSSVSLLTGNHSMFKNSMNYEKNKVNINDLVVLLNKDFKVDEAELKKQIRKHPYWMYTSLMQVKNTFEFLKKNFSLDDIYTNLYAVFYPRDSINIILQELNEKYSNTGDFCCAPTQFLALCIYKMELDHHFSGDGIWTEENQKNRNQLQQDLKEKTSELTS